MKIMTTTKNKYSNCPNCNYHFDAHQQINDRKKKPRIGDFTICINCGEILRYEKKGVLRLAKHIEIISLDINTLTMLISAQIIIKELIKK